MNETKICNRCGKEKPLSEFHKRRASADGFSYGCKECKKANARRWYRENREHVLSKMAGYYEENADEIRANRKIYYSQNRDEINEKKREKYWKNPEASREEKHREYRENKESYKARARKWRTENHERYLRNIKEWQKRNPERARENSRRVTERRRARKNQLADDLTAEEWNEILSFYDNRCAYCGEPAYELHQEHVIPVCQGGGYTKKNIVPACPICNAIKGGRTPEQAGIVLADKIEW